MNTDKTTLENGSQPSCLGAVSSRFFFFVYSYWIDNAGGKGNLCIKSKKFPQQEYVKAKAVEQVSNKYNKPMYKVSAVVESWIEMSEDDYNDWLS